MLSKVSLAIVNFLTWWVVELKGLFAAPERFGAGRFPRRLVLSIGDTKIRILDERANHVAELTGKSDGLATLKNAAYELSQVARKRPRTPVGLRFANKVCFARRVELPAAARIDVGKVLDLELERTTPFRRDDVYAAHHIDDETASRAGKLAVDQLVIKKSTVDPALAALSDAGIAPTFIDCWNKDNTAPYPVDFLAQAQGNDGERERGIGLAGALMAVSVALAVAAIATVYVRHQNALVEISAATATAKKEAHLFRQELDKSKLTAARIESLERARRVRVSAAQILEEVTIMIPDTAWLSDMRIDETTVEFTGYAKSAASLIALFEKSKLFVAATLTAPVMLDTRRDKERFSIRVRLSGAAPTPGASPSAQQEVGR